MTAILDAVIAILAAWNPPAAARRIGPFERRAVLGIAVGAVATAVVAALGNPVIDVLGVSEPTFRTAAGAVIGVVGLGHLAGRRPQSRTSGTGASPAVIAALTAMSPGPVFAALAASLGAGWGWAVIGLVAAATLTVVPPWRAREPVTGWACRLVGALAVLIGVVLVIDGIATV